MINNVLSCADCDCCLLKVWSCVSWRCDYDILHGINYTYRLTGYKPWWFWHDVAMQKNVAMINNVYSVVFGFSHILIGCEIWGVNAFTLWLYYPFKWWLHKIS